ncbi:hypothetical protein GTA08_BOTSDO11362 [Neofusicoccum parvum]|uniref:Uncharacterized protein n=2 Tax=Neofusicoccum parvum TaxID=310453 RepID=R1GZY9_BOTPV|nr:hypothetical protein UCRNP2_1509 [Neofusicoccum parvum UCRNP2]GME28593.1 hypothetical protein GTA08_BOTSDO11362 [Neofusicoccum parvum]GME58714.1 hypothetical protein GTA08_BOTSDO11362 [Neofusicoccum parvum]
MKGSLSRTSSTCSLIRAAVAASDDDSDASLLAASSRAAQHQQQQRERDALELQWYSIVSTYSKLTSATTYRASQEPDDRLAALADTAERFFRKLQASRLLQTPPPASPHAADFAPRFSASTSPVYCAGLWPAFLPASLLWFVVYGKQRFPPSAGAPSWSWASVEGGYVYWDAQWPRSEAPWPVVQQPDVLLAAQSNRSRFPRLDPGLQVLQTRCLPSGSGGGLCGGGGGDPFGGVSKGVIKLRCCVCPVLPVADYHVKGSSASRVLQGCIIDDPRVRKAVLREAEMADLDWVATSLRVWEDRGRRNDHLKLLFDLRLSLDEFSARKYEVLYCVKFFEYAPSSVAWGHHDGLLVRRRKGSKNEYERVGLWKCTRSSMFDDKYQVIKLV